MGGLSLCSVLGEVVVAVVVVAVAVVAPPGSAGGGGELRPVPPPCGTPCLSTWGEDLTDDVSDG